MKTRKTLEWIVAKLPALAAVPAGVGVAVGTYSGMPANHSPSLIDQIGAVVIGVTAGMGTYFLGETVKLHYKIKKLCAEGEQRQNYKQ